MSFQSNTSYGTNNCLDCRGKWSIYLLVYLGHAPSQHLWIIHCYRFTWEGWRHQVPVVFEEAQERHHWNQILSMCKPVSDGGFSFSLSHKFTSFNADSCTSMQLVCCLEEIVCTWETSSRCLSSVAHCAPSSHQIHTLWQWGNNTQYSSSCYVLYYYNKSCSQHAIFTPDGDYIIRLKLYS